MAFFVPANVRNRVWGFDESGADPNRFTIVSKEDDRLGNVSVVAGFFIIMNDVFGLELVLGCGINQMNLIGWVVATVD